MTNDDNLRYNWTKDIEPHLSTLQDVVGGFTSAERGVVALEDGSKIFVKIATDENTAKWLKKEIKVYKKLNSLGYKYAPLLLSCRGDQEAIAIEYLEGASFDNIWDKDKLDAVVKAQKALSELTEHFIDDNDFKSGNVAELNNKWPKLITKENIGLINSKFAKLGAPELQFSKDQLEQYALLNKDWKLKEDTLIHEDIRADNFGYDPLSKEGKLVDWNWLCIGDKSLDSTPLFVDMLKGGFNPYEYHPKKYDKSMIAYLVSFWLDLILEMDEDASERNWRSSAHRVENVRVCLDLMNKR